MLFFFSSRRRHTRSKRDWSSDVCSSDLADLIREDTFFYEGNTHLPMEQHAAVGNFDPDNKLTLWSSTQTPHYVHRRSEERRVGKESRSRWSPEHSKKKAKMKEAPTTDV